MTSDVVMTLKTEHFLYFYILLANMQITLKNTLKINLAKCRFIRNQNIYFFQNTLSLIPSTLETYQIFNFLEVLLSGICRGCVFVLFCFFELHNKTSMFCTPINSITKNNNLTLSLFAPWSIQPVISLLGPKNA